MNDWMDAENHAERAGTLYSEGRWVEAIAELRAALDIDPENASCFFNLGLTLEAMQEYRTACDAFKSSLRLDPDDIEALTSVGVNLTHLGKFRDALKYFERTERIDPTFEPAWCHRIVTYTEMGRHAEAELMFYIARQIRDECPMCSFNLGDSFYLRGMYDSAIKSWKDALRMDPLLEVANARIADALCAAERPREALEYYRREIGTSGYDEDTMLDMGETLLELEMLDQAEEIFSRVLSQNKSCTAANYNLGEFAIRRGEYDIAATRLGLVLEQDRDFPGARVCMAGLMLKRGQKRDAAKLIDEELQIYGDDADTLRQVGELLLDNNLANDAKRVFERLIALLPKDADAQHYLAVSCFMQDNASDGIAHCRKALKLKPEFPRALCDLAQAYMNMGSIDRARRYASRAMLICPNDEGIREISATLKRAGRGRKKSLRKVSTRGKNHGAKRR